MSKTATKTATPVLEWSELQALNLAFVEDLEQRRKTGCKTFRTSGSIARREYGPSFKTCGKAAGTWRKLAARLDALK
jgi:hypothetical protein